MKKVFRQMAIIAVLVLGFVLTASAQKVGGFKKVSVDNERVVAAANFAVSKQEENEEGLTLDSIERAETQVVAGTNFKLCLKVSLADESQEVKVVVFQNLKQEFSLTSWDVENCGEDK
jgi:Aspartic acid proteinase inhibitor